MKSKESTKSGLTSVSHASNPDPFRNLHFKKSKEIMLCATPGWSIPGRGGVGCVPLTGTFSGKVLQDMFSFNGQSAFSCSFRWHLEVGGTLRACSLTFRITDVTVDPRDSFVCLSVPAVVAAGGFHQKASSLTG